MNNRLLATEKVCDLKLNVTDKGDIPFYLNEMSPLLIFELVKET